MRFTIAAVLLLFAPVAARAQSCDRNCLGGFIDQYVDALVAHDPTRVPVTADVKFTENGQRLTLGDGFWNSVTGKGTYKLVIADPPKGQVAAFVTMREAPDTPLIVALRLKVENRRLSEIEVLLAHTEQGARNLERIGAPRAALLRATPPGDRMSRADLIRVANLYFSGMQQNDGKGQYPFADDCDRLENGTQTTNNPTGGRPS